MRLAATPDDRPLITVLGASGFVGSAVTAALARRRCRVRAVARRPGAPVRPGAAEMEWCAADLTDTAQLARALAGSDAVLHLLLNDGGWRAAENDPGSERLNVGVMRALLEELAARDGRRPPALVVYAGAASQIGVPPDGPIDGSEPDAPLARYDRQKLAAERLLKEASAAGVVRGISLRLATVFGPGRGPRARDRGIVTTMARRALAGEPLTMWHDGSVRRDLIYVNDVARSFLAALDHPDPLAGRHWLVGTGSGQPLGRVFSMIAESVAAHTGRPPVPVVTVTPPGDAPHTDFKSLTLDPSRFREATGWEATVALPEALDRTVAGLAANP
ncbi:NAD-dependent epimerase/dehydratase [Actinomadura kijaniata]|uniref:Sugar 4-ketoreductase n=1 Tax=Actinomadura kijaniata TaxID=46161 RepID=B3TMP6_ACTKI|nr:NAD-dependent epimerase/dehydratase [Actinomadura kijaniata]ACB46476.1 sugar 4-ketoreductase [Actinomadura kijaniata]